jgi:hypothetical protein
MKFISRYVPVKKMNFSNCSKAFKSYESTLPEIYEAFSGVSTKGAIKDERISTESDRKILIKKRYQSIVIRLNLVRGYLPNRQASSLNTKTVSKILLCKSFQFQSTTLCSEF